MPAFSMQRAMSVGRKEMIHILRDPMTLFFTLFIPILELFMLGYAIDTNVRQIRTVILDQAATQESRQLIRRFEYSDDFRVVRQVDTDEEMRQLIVSGQARVGIKIPADYSRNLLARMPAQVLVQVDGSESSVASEAVNVGNALALRESLARVLGDQPLPIDARPSVLFNPDTRSSNFFLPGLLVVMCQITAVMLTATAIVREKENGTLEQIFMTPVRPGELIFGKVTPYLVVTFVEFCMISFLMVLVFRVPVNGFFGTLLGLALPFTLTMLGLGLFISTKASTRDAAQQMAMATVIPSIFLSGYVFPLDSMPVFFWWVAQLFPTTWLIDAARGVFLRGASAVDLKLHAIVLWTMAAVIFTSSILRFHRRVT
jgi:ABC-2 type transport system permease protein